MSYHIFTLSLFLSIYLSLYLSLSLHAIVLRSTFLVCLQNSHILIMRTNIFLYNEIN